MRGIVLDVSQGWGLELADEFAQTSGVVQQRAQACCLCWVQRAGDGLVIDLAGPGSRLVTGCSWDVAARLTPAGETTVGNRRTQWLEAGVFDKLVEEAIAAAAVGMSGKEGDIFRKVVGWSLGFLAFMCVLVYLQSTPVLSWMLP